MSLQASPSSPRKLTALGLTVAAVGIMGQYVSGVDYPTIPPGAIILAAAAGVVAFGHWRWAPAVGLGVAVFISIGGTIATAAGNGFNDSVGDPGAIGGFSGGVIQIAGLVIALAAGTVAVGRRRGESG